MKEMENVGMLSSKKIDNIKMLIRIVQNFFGENVCGFEETALSNDEDFQIECIVYKSYLVSFSLADIPKGGIFNANIAIGGKMVGLYLLSDDKDKITLSFTEESIMNSLEELNKYMIWCMSNTQKETLRVK